MSRIVNLEVTNFKRIKAVSVKPTGSVVSIRGRNGQGKTSTLDAISAVFGGEKLCPAQPIRRGETEAVVRARLDQYEDFGSIVAERTFHLREDGSVKSELRLLSDDGVKLDKPQRRLDELIGVLSFDPLAFMRRAPKEQAETLRKLSGVDFKLLDGRRQRVYDDRTIANRQVTQLRARLAARPIVNAPDAEESAAALVEQQQKRTEQAAANDARRRDLAAARARYGEIEDLVRTSQIVIAKLEKELADARAELAAHQQDLATTLERGQTLKAEVEQLVDPDMDEIPAKLRDVEAVNERVRQKKERAAIADELAKAEAEAKRLDAEIAAVDQQKAAILAEAHLPVEGLSFDDSGATLNGIPLEQASQAEQLRVSVAIGCALNPKLRAMLVRDGSLLDKDSLALLRAEAEKGDLQVWLEMVGKEGEGIVIEDGEVESVKEAANG